MIKYFCGRKKASAFATVIILHSDKIYHTKSTVNMKNNAKSKLSLAKLIFSMTVFGTVGIVVRNVSLPSGFVAMSRGYIGALVIFLFMLFTGRLPSIKKIRKNLAPLLLSGAFIGVNWILLFESYSYTGVATATLCYYMAPVFVIIASSVLLSEKVGVIKAVSAAAAFLGMLLVCEPWGEFFGEAGLLGVVLALGAALFYAAVTITNKKMKDISSLDITLVQLFAAALTITPYTIFAEKITPSMFDIKSVVLVLVMGLLHTGAAYLLYFASIKELDAAKVAIFAYIDPIVALVLSALVLKEKMTVFGIIGAVLILVATLASEILPTLKPRRKKELRAEENRRNSSVD